jgi:membrane protein
VQSILARVIRELIRGGPQRRAASLAFTTALSLVPLGAVAFAFLKATNLFNAQKNLLGLVSRSIPGIGPAIIEKVSTFIDHINLGAIGGGAFVVLLVLAFLLFDQIEEAFNDIWGVTTGRTYFGKFLVFYCLVTLGPLLLAGSLAQSARLFEGRPLLTVLVTMLPSWLAFIMANKLLPRGHVDWKAAVSGGLFSAVLFELVRWGFNLYLKAIALTTYTTIYGALGLVPLFFLWLYLSWLIVIAGAHVAYAVQHSYLFIGNDPARSVREHDSLVAVRLLTDVARAYVSGEGPLNREQLTRHHRLASSTVDRVLNRLVEARYLAMVHGYQMGHVPARPLDQMVVEDIFAAFGEEAPQPSPAPGASGVDELARRLHEARRAITTRLTVAELVRDGKGQGPILPPPPGKSQRSGSAADDGDDEEPADPVASLLAHGPRVPRTPN